MQPELLDRILSKMERPNHYFLINIDKKSASKKELKTVANKHSNVICITDMNIMHGGFSQISCTLRQLEFARQYEINFDYYHTMSGQDYPCVDADRFDQFFEGSQKSYTMMDTDEECTEWKKNKYRRRLEHYYVNDIFNTRFFIKIKISSILWRLLYKIPRKYPNIETIWGGGGTGSVCIVM